MSVDWRTQPVWDEIWGRFFAAAYCRTRNPNKAIAEADKRMADNGHGQRPTKENQA